MFAAKLVQHMKRNAERMSEGFIQKLNSTGRSSEFFQRVPVDDEKHSVLEIYQHLADWLPSMSGSDMQERYVRLGIHRAQQGVPFSQVLWTTNLAKDYFWEYMQQECLLEEPVEFWGGVQLLRSMQQFFDRGIFFVALGYEKTAQNKLADTA